MAKKPCRLCLLKDIDPKEYEAKIKRVIDMMKPNEKCGDSIYKNRLDECVNCSYLKDGFCMACGCYVELRAIKKDSDCPYEKW